MISKRKYDLKNIYYIFASVLVVVAIFMMFAKCVSLGAKSDKLTISFVPAYFTGIEAVFGHEGSLKFSPLNLLTYLLAIASLIMLIIKAFGVKKCKSLNAIIPILLVVCGIMFFLSGIFLVKESATPIKGLTITKNCETGAIVSGIMCLLASLASILPMVRYKKHGR